LYQKKGGDIKGIGAEFQQKTVFFVKIEVLWFETSLF